VSDNRSSEKGKRKEKRGKEKGKSVQREAGKLLMKIKQGNFGWVHFQVTNTSLREILHVLLDSITSYSITDPEPGIRSLIS
jgi:hypothetical protein